MIAHMLYNVSGMLLLTFINDYTILWNINDEHMPIWLIIITFVSITAGVVLFARRIIPEDEKPAEIAEPSKEINLLTPPESEEI